MLIGDMSQAKEEIEIVDGQQRLTTFTIFLSALSDVCYSIDKNISDIIWKYVIGKDDNDESYVVLRNETASPYFQAKIQKRSLDTDEYKENLNEVTEYEENILTAEEERIKYAYDFFREKLSEKILNSELNSKKVNVKYVDLIKLIRNQLLESQTIYIASKDKNSVNKIFENINARGKQLSPIDLIKNEIFSVENSIIPKDDAKEIWEKIKSNLHKENFSISMEIFFRHFWNAKYNKSPEKNLYDQFLVKVKREEYYEFIKNLEKSSKNYFTIIKPDINSFLVSNNGNGINKTDIRQLIDTLTSLSEYFQIVQVRVILLALYEAYLNKKINFKKFKSILKFIEEFHYVYNGICKERTNRLEDKYSSFARKINEVKDSKKLLEIVEDLKKELIELKPNLDTFISKFLILTFHKNYSNKLAANKNLIVKYSVRKYEELFCKNGVYDFDQASVEHIIADNREKTYTGFIGNLVILESSLNEKAGNTPIKNKIHIYKISKYKSIEELLKKYLKGEKPVFDENTIKKRTEEIGKIIYNNIMK